MEWKVPCIEYFLCLVSFALSLISLLIYHLTYLGSFPGGSRVRNLPASARDAGSIPRLGRFPGEGMATHSNMLAWETSWTGKPEDYGSWGCKRVRHN